LEIPDLPNDINSLRWQIPNTSNYEWINYHNQNRTTITKTTTTNESENIEDEGFCSSKSCSPNSSKEITHQEQEQENLDEIWSKALKLTISDYIDWEMRDENLILINETINNHNDKYLLIDSSRAIFDKFYYNYINTCSIILNPNVINEQRIVITESKFITDCLNVLISLPSISFIINNETFVFNQLLHISGISCESLYSYSSEYALIGTYHKCLLKFIQIPDTDLTCGSVFRSYCNAIKSYLNLYNEEIISNLKRINTFTVTSLYCKFKLWMDQIKFLIEICQINSSDTLKGLDLIFYLFKLCKNYSSNTLNYSILLHLFTKSLQPFLMFIENWIYLGEFSDPFNEFLIDFNFSSLISKDKHFLNKTYKLKDKYLKALTNHNDDDDSFLLKNIYQDLFNCGKSLALLKICHSKHFLCNLTTYPKLNINLNASYLKTIDLICNDYVNFVSINAKNELKTRYKYVKTFYIFRLEYIYLS
jgi:hypothetical protein